MSEASKITDRAAELATQAVQAAGPVIERAKDVAGEIVVKAGPYVERAAGVAAHGVAMAADQLDKATNHKYSDKITTVSSKIEGTLGHNRQG